MTSKRRVPHEPKAVKTVIAVMWRKGFDVAPVVSEIERDFGAVISRSDEFEFDQSNYYLKEMGEGLRKIFIEITGEFARDTLPGLKHKALAIEENHALPDGARVVNVDPMHITLENITIATTKSFPHRAYLFDGIYADVHLYRQGGRYKPMPWTYKDYEAHLDFFEKVREKLL